MRIPKLLFYLLILSFVFSINASTVSDTSTLNDFKGFLETNNGIFDVHFFSTIPKEIQGTYVSVLYYDSLGKDNDTTFSITFKDSSITTFVAGTDKRRVDTPTIICDGTYKTTGAKVFVHYTSNNVFIDIAKPQGNLKNIGEYSLLLIYKDAKGPHTINYILKKLNK